MKTGITGHMIVKNEDAWVWFAIQSVLPYLDKLLIIDTGSSDQTLKCIRSIESDKIVLSQVSISSREDLTLLRNKQIQATKTNWIWIIDGDEIYTEDGAKEVVSATRQNYHGIAARRYDLLGDIYHRQDEGVGEYQLLGQQGHLLVRLINLSNFPGLHVSRPYPLEAYLDRDDQVVHSYTHDKWYITTSHLYHAMYLKRSSLGSNLPMFNRGKYKIETGIKIADKITAVFTLPRPSFVPDPLVRRGLDYELAASIITPIKNLKRKLI